ncbi:MAG: hypothetical protein HETSPECPRED_003641 [Heterodermia speciosa]|uniref:Uncharacterized protein n=1 Tax=Heterodermia speciosa TaxID=116794 RepID=A0A8H3J697_9LECA|nr:MAG: hypothetical protein HETSPECPRED_003641 [Heterodermia speciosa]
MTVRLFDNPVPTDWTVNDDLPPVGWALSDSWKYAVSWIPADVRYSRWPATFDSTGRIRGSDKGRGAPALVTRNGEEHYLIAYGNVVLFGSEGHGYGLNRLTKDQPSGKPSAGVVGRERITKEEQKFDKMMRKKSTNKLKRRAPREEYEYIDPDKIPQLTPPPPTGRPGLPSFNGNFGLFDNEAEEDNGSDDKVSGDNDTDHEGDIEDEDNNDQSDNNGAVDDASESGHSTTEEEDEAEDRNPHTPPATASPSAKISEDNQTLTKPNTKWDGRVFIFPTKVTQKRKAPVSKATKPKRVKVDDDDSRFETKDPHADNFYNKPVPENYSQTTHLLPPRGSRLADSWKWAIRELSGKERHKFYPENFESHGRIVKGDDGTGAPAIISQDNMNHYLVAYGNIQLFGEEGKAAGLQRIVDGPELCKAGIGRPGELVLGAKLAGVAKSGQSAKLSPTLLNSSITPMGAKLAGMGKPGQSAKPSPTLLNSFLTPRKTRKAKLAAVGKSGTSKTKTPTLLPRLKEEATTANGTESEDEKAESSADGEAVASSSVAGSKRRATAIKTVPKEIKAEVETDKNSLLTTAEQDHLRTILSSSDSEPQISPDKSLLYADAMVRNLASLLSTATVGLYDASSRQTSIKKLEKKYAQFRDRYDLDLKPVEEGERFIPSKHLYTLFQPDPNRFQTLANKFEARETKGAGAIMVRGDSGGKGDKKSAIKGISRKKSKETGAG